MLTKTVPIDSLRGTIDAFNGSKLKAMMIGKILLIENIIISKSYFVKALFVVIL